MRKRFFLLLSALLTINILASARQVSVYCYMAGPSAKVSNDGSIRARITTEANGTAFLEVENLTDKIIFVRRGRSFSLVNNISEPLFIPQSNTESYSMQRGIIMDMGPADYMKSVTSESRTSSRTVYDQHTLPIAPHGRSTIYVWENLPERLRTDIICTGFDGQGKGRFMDTNHKFHRGDRRDYTEENTPLHLAADVEYSFSEHGSTAQRLYLQSYVSSICVGKSGNGNYLNASSGFSHGFYFRSGNSLISKVVAGTFLGTFGTIFFCGGLLLVL